MDARCNWWGDASGPYHNVTNTSSLGDRVSDNVEYYPWSDAQYPIMGDINSDCIVNIVDIVIVALAFGSAAEDDPETPWNETRNWNPEADLNGDGIVDIVDLVIVGVNFGKGCA